jgi:hypothetical protein
MRMTIRVRVMVRVRVRMRAEDEDDVVVGVGVRGCLFRKTQHRPFGVFFCDVFNGYQAFFKFLLELD